MIGKARDKVVLKGLGGLPLRRRNMVEMADSLQVSQALESLTLEVNWNLGKVSFFKPIFLSMIRAHSRLNGKVVVS